MNKYKRSKTLDTLHILGLVGVLSAEERKTTLRNFSRLYPGFLGDLEDLAGDAMESNDRTQAKALCDDLKACCEVLVQYPEDAAEILQQISEIEVRLLKDRLEGGKVKKSTPERGKPVFADLINPTEDKEEVLRRLHAAIDGQRCSHVGRVISRAVWDGWLYDIPTQAQFKEEFTLEGTWGAIHKYLHRAPEDLNEKELDKVRNIKL